MKRRRLEVQMYDHQTRRVVTLREVNPYMFAAVSQSKLVQVVIAAIIGAELAIVEPAVESGDLDAFNGDLAKIAIFAALAAAFRAVKLYVNKPQ